MLLAMMKHVLIIVFLLQIIGVHHESRCNKRKRTPDTELPYHAKRRRVSWTALVRNLGPLEFHRHHRVSVALFNKIHDRILPHIATKDKYARRSCCRGSVSAVDSRSRLSMLLKHLAGSKMQDIERAHGVSRSTVIASIASVMDAIVKEFPIHDFPFEDPDELKRLADGFRRKSSGDLFDNVIGAFDGYLLHISQSCITKRRGVTNPSKFYCRKQFFAINCQVCCDAERRVTYVSMLSPGAVPDTLAFFKSNIHRAITLGKVPAQCHFVADNACPDSDSILTPCTRADLQCDVRGQMDNYNFYLSQMRINIECCFGMLVNRFPILLHALSTTKLTTATKTFMVCCILHNLCVDERLASEQMCTNSDTSMRYTQRSRQRYQDLVADADFEYVQRVDEAVADELSRLHALTAPTIVHDEGITRKERMVYKIVESGHRRPSRNRS